MRLLSVWSMALAILLSSTQGTSAFSNRPDLAKSFQVLSPRTLITNVVRGRLNVNKKSQDKFIKTLFQLAKQYKFDPLLLLSIVEHESRFNTKAIGAVGERGLMQIRPETAEWIAQKMKLHYRGADSLFDPSENLKVGVAYLVYLRNDHSKMADYLAAYNMGPIKFKRLVKRGVQPKIYYKKVFEIYSYYQPNASAIALIDEVSEIEEHL